MTVRIIFGAALFALGLNTAQAEPLRIGTWNIENLHHAEGVALRSFEDDDGGPPTYTVRRDEDDFRLLEQYRDLFGRDGRAADVIALQEIGTGQALERLFPSSDYITIMSERWPGVDTGDGEGDVYTAIAVRRESGVSVVRSEYLEGLIVYDEDGNPTRAGTAALLDYEGQEFWFLSVHLKSSCSTTVSIDNPDRSEDCRLLWEQTPALADWIAQHRSAGIPFIVAGDFNRRFRQLNFEEPLWNAMNGAGPDEEIMLEPLIAHPLSVTRRCATRRGRSTQPIDWIILSPDLADNFVGGSYWERRFSNDDVQETRYGSRTTGLSDHCPISIDLAL
jgi:exonuclease III